MNTTKKRFQRHFLLFFLTVLFTHSQAQQRFWVGGSGNWNDTQRWSTSSGGSAGASVPNASNDVIFDANSFSSAGNVVTINIAASCKSMNWTGVTNTPTLAGVSNLTVSGDLILFATMNVTYTGYLTLNSTGPATINLQNKLLDRLDFNGSGTFNLSSQLRSNTVFLTQGVVNTNNHTLTIGSLRATSGAQPITLNAGTSTIFFSGTTHDITKTGFTGNLTSSTFIFNATPNNSTFTATVPVNFGNVIVQNAPRLDIVLNSAFSYGFGDVTVADGQSLVITGHSGDKTFGKLTTGTNGTATISGRNTFNGAVTIGSVDVTGRSTTIINGPNVFNKPVTVHGPSFNTNSVQFYKSNFHDTVTLKGNGANTSFVLNCNFYRLLKVEDRVSGTPTLRMVNIDTLFEGLYVGNRTRCFLTAGGAANRTVFYDSVVIGDTLNDGDCSAFGSIEFYGPLKVGNRTVLQWVSGGGQATFRNKVTVGNNSNVILRRRVWFLDSYVQGTGGIFRCSDLSDTARFDGPVTLGGKQTEIRFLRTSYFGNTLTIGDSATNIVFNESTSGSNVTRFTGPVVLGNHCNMTIHRGAVFSSTLNTGIGTTFNTNSTESGILNFTQFVGNVNFGGGTIALRRTSIFNANLTVGDSSTITFNGDGGFVDFGSAPNSAFAEFKTNSIVQFQTGTGNGNNVFRNFILRQNVRCFFTNNSLINTFRTIQLTRFVTLVLNTGTGSNNIVTEGVSDENTCGSWNLIRSNDPGLQSNITLNAIDSLSELIVHDINSTNQQLRVYSGVNMVNNSGAIVFFNIRVPTTYYWVPGVGGSSNWRDSTNWSLVSGDNSLTHARQCIPTPDDSVVFDIHSFTPTQRTVTIDNKENFCRGMNWTGGYAADRLPILNGNSDRKLNVYGELHMPPFGQITVNFTGTFEFNANETTEKHINGNSTQFKGPFVFNSRRGNWLITSPLDLRGGAIGSLTIRRGKLNGNSSAPRTISLEGGWRIENSDTSIAQFLPGLSTVNFRGDQTVSIVYYRNNSFYNLTVDKTLGRVVQIRGSAPSDSLMIRNNLTITQGYLSDAGVSYNEGPYQIIGNTTGTGVLTIGANGFLEIGRSATSAGPNDTGVPGLTTGSGDYLHTVFPRGWGKTQINIDPNGTVTYRRNGFQSVSHIPNYGKLSLLNPTSDRLVHYATGEITFNGLLTVGNFITFADSGYQLIAGGSAQLTLNPGSELQLGNQTSNTTFPFNTSSAAIFMSSGSTNSTVIFNSSSLSTQNIAGLIGPYPQVYQNVIIRSALAFRGSRGTPTVSRITSLPIRKKELLGDIYIRGDLTIESNNELDVSASSHNIQILGHWLGETGSVFTSRNGAVSFQGGITQTYQAPTSNHNLHTVTIQKSINNVTLNSPMIVNNQVNFIQEDIVASQANYLQFNDNATVGTAGNAPKSSSHVNGYVRKIGDDAFTFPVGNGTVYRPIGISAPTNLSTSFEANYILGIAPHPVTGVVLPPTLDRVSVAEHWNLNRLVDAGAGTSDVRVTLSWDNPTSGGVQSFDSLVVARWNGSTWIDHGPEVGVGRTGNNTAGTVTTTSSLSSFSPFTLGSRSLVIFNPLPVNLISFDAKQAGVQTLLDWQVAQEIGLASYTVQRSTDGRSFTDLSTTPAKGLPENQNYQSIDPQPAKGNNYYRLKMNDLDGAYEYSSVVIVNHGLGKDLIFSAYPNPTDGSRITFAELAQGLSIQLIQIHNELGQLIQPDQQVLSQRKELEAVFSKPLTPGVYIATLGVEGSDEVTRIKFLVQ